MPSGIPLKDGIYYSILYSKDGNRGKYFAPISNPKNNK